ncbi:hypothetical protein [Streptomyces chrestomyceticus]|uniref:hypothetical protein n=1 Tax=Streptomyces chrestomyceticus TaxID=68185 RepID=UPI0019D14B3B|nr:hypothetical protein [Streptomyces chrestomyceticus]
MSCTVAVDVDDPHPVGHGRGDLRTARIADELDAGDQTENDDGIVRRGPGIQAVGLHKESRPAPY